MNVRPFLATVVLGLLAACSSLPSPQMQRAEHLPGTQAGGIRTDALPETMGNAGPQPVIRRGASAPINQAAASAPPPSLASTGQASFNFEGESLQAVVKAILGDMLGQSYSIAPGVQGTVTIATQKPVGSAGALNLLEGVLAQNNARMVYSDGRYNIVTADQALTSGVVPRTGSPALARGFESRVVPLRYVSAAEMEKILKPYAKQGSIVSVDGARNIITVAGTRAELENYLRTIQVFDVDWMASMSVGVFPLQSGRASQVVQDLERVFGEASKTPVSGMFRFMPLDSANAVMVITSQPNYLDDIRQWIDRIEGGSGDGRLFSYELKYIKARDLADRLAEVFGNGNGSAQGGGQGEASLMPGLDSTEIRDGGVDDKGSTSNAAVGGSGSGGDGASLPSSRSGNGRVNLRVDGVEVGVSALEDTNSLLVRATPAAWKSIREVIDRIDVMPSQVHIEAQVVSVALTGALQYGVSWFFDHAVDEEAGLPYPTGRNSWGSYSSSVAPQGEFGNLLTWTFLGNNAAAIVQALDNVSNVRTLSSPSVFTQNNKEASLNVGQRIPINSVSFDPNNNGNTNGTYSQVQYLETGIILKVRPRITRDGMVFMDIVQEVSKPTGTADRNGNVRIDTNKVKTSAVVPSGETIMLAGLITDGVSKNSMGIPGLSRIPILGGLFGQQGTSNSRDELVVLITPTVVRNPLEARELTDEYGRRFRALDPIYNPKAK